ncbi:hypothetical protein [Pyxidicoccus sp. MSG2]|uniref:Mom family adenine methylcarbamoylation protein n=1 Tax=Pyxidicoccus sp. MSG2 TaxID=2996790 RepID=UPI0022716404|nr:hypothetical protein [Pyxidicoccus sp. MSG2]MCY1023958.1 hypothetical protein [Pyxidicoccus sp. MSG2]
MLSQSVQRWLFGQDSYRVAGEHIDAAAYDVEELPDDSTARAFVLAHHYSASYPAARFRYGLFHRSRLVGVAVYSHPVNDAVLEVLPGGPRDGVELGRFILLDDVPANGESWFIARTFELLRREGLAGVVSFSDPVQRRSHTGALVFGGHVGTIYQASNARYLGRGTPRTQRLLPNGQVLSPRALQKIRRRESGWRYASRFLVEYGATPLGADEDAAAWLSRWLPRLTTKFRHAGCHKYAWALRRRDWKHLPSGLSYPKAFGREPRKLP